MVEGHSKKVIDQVKSLVEGEVSYTMGATTSTIMLVASKTFFSKHFLNEDGEGLVEVAPLMDKFIALSSLNVLNLNASFKHRLRNIVYVFNDLTLKANNGYCFILDGCFPRQ